jgi:hypothetical protein
VAREREVNKKILIVEDDKIVSKVLGWRLTGLGSSGQFIPLKRQSLVYAANRSYIHGTDPV